MRSLADCLAALGAEEEGVLPDAHARWLFGALLDEGVPDMELGALLATLKWKGGTPGLLPALLSAIGARITRWASPAVRGLPIVIGCYGGTRESPNAVPLLALLLARSGVPVLLHGPLHSDSGVAAALVLRELGILPCARHAEALRGLGAQQLAFVPTALVAPGLAALLALAPRIGTAPLLVTAARLLDPFESGALLVAGAHSQSELALMREAAGALGMNALVAEATEGEALANPIRRPRMERLAGAAAEVLFEPDAAVSRRSAALPAGADTRATAAWIREILSGSRALPAPLMTQLAACLYACGHCEDMNEARAMAAITAGGRQIA